MENRWGERIRIDIPVQIVTPTLSFGLAFIRDLSLSGAGISALRGLCAPSRVEIIVASSAQPDGAVPAKLSALVTRSDANGIGVEWTEYAPLAVSDLIRQRGSSRLTRVRTVERPYRSLDSVLLI